jgi:hypothetical protein
MKSREINEKIIDDKSGEIGRIDTLIFMDLALRKYLGGPIGVETCKDTNVRMAHDIACEKLLREYSRSTFVRETASM